MYELLRFVYTQQQHSKWDRNWRLQLEISKTAQKYLYPALYRLAMSKSTALVTRLSDASTVFEIITYIRDNSEDATVLRTAETLQTRHFLALMKDDKYKAWISEDKTVMWKCVDQLTDFKAGLQETQVGHCKVCHAAVTKRPLDLIYHRSQNTMDLCMHVVENRLTCWTPKTESAALAEFVNASVGDVVEMKLVFCQTCGGSKIYDAADPSIPKTHDYRPNPTAYASPFSAGNAPFPAGRGPNTHALTSTSCWVPKDMPGSLPASVNKQTVWT